MMTGTKTLHTWVLCWLPLLLIISLTQCTPFKASNSGTIQNDETTPTVEQLAFIFPQDGAELDYDSIYQFKVSPVPGADGYQWTFIQKDIVVWDNLRDTGKLTANELLISPRDSAYVAFKRGPLRIQVRALIAAEWTQVSTITIHLR